MRTLTDAQIKSMHPMSGASRIKKPGTAKPKPQEVKVEVKQDPSAPPVVNVTVDTSDIAGAVSKVLNAQQPVTQHEPTKEWEFTIKRDSNNLIETIIAKAK